MRRMEQNLAEKRVLQSIEKKNNLRITYERLKLEEKAFMSSTKFNQRQVLSKQNKLRQLQYTAQNCKGLSLEKRPKFRSFPGLPATSEGVTRSYPSNLALPSSRKSLRTSGEGKHARSLPEKEAFDRNQSALNSSSKFLYSAFNNSANEKQNEFQVPLKQGETKFSADSKTKQIGLRVDDIISYSTRFGKRAETSRKGISSTDRENMDTTENQPSSKNENFTVTNEKIWKSDVDSLTTTRRKMCVTTKSPEKEELNSIESILSPVQSKKDWLVRFTSDQHHISDEIKTGKEYETNEDKPTVVRRTEDRLPRDVNLRDMDDLEKNSAQFNANTTSEELKTLTDSRISTSLQNSQPQKIDGPNVFVSLNSNPSLDPLEDSFDFDRASSCVQPLISRKPSWNGYEDLPALSRIRRGSFCDVKTFTSGKVLDLLSLCEVPSPDSEKGTKQYLYVDDENLKYCRYLRPVTPDEALQDGERLGIPQKYRPSKNIIIGHTKVTPLI